MTNQSTAGTTGVREKTVYTLDLNFMGVKHTIAAYLILHASGAVLVESGPGSTQVALVDRLRGFGLAPSDITDVLLTHIHLDHAGAAGWLASQGARIHVHPVGAPHLLNPEKLLSSAARIYGDLMKTLWGDFLPVPPERLSVIQDGDVIEVGDLRFQAIDTPGHAEHHYVYIYDDVCFSGDIGGVRLPGPPHLRLPMPPPEFNLEKWHLSLEKLKRLEIKRIAPTHFGVFDDPGWHLAEIGRALAEVEAWMEQVMPSNPEANDLNNRFVQWAERRSLSAGLDMELIQAYETANPSWMSSLGIQRYWNKHRSPAE